MKTKFILFVPLLLSLISHTLADQVKIDENILITGTWNCLIEIKEDQGKILITSESEERYVRNGKSHSFGNMLFKFKGAPNEPEIPEMEFFVAVSAIWEIKGKYLITEIIDIKSKNLSHPEFEELINLEDFFPKNISGSQEIIELSNSKLTLKDESGGEIYSCTKN